MKKETKDVVEIRLLDLVWLGVVLLLIAIILLLYRNSAIHPSFTASTTPSDQDATTTPIHPDLASSKERLVGSSDVQLKGSTLYAEGLPEMTGFHSLSSLERDGMAEEWLNLIVSFYQSLTRAYQLKDANTIMHLERELHDFYRADITHYTELELIFGGSITWIMLDVEGIQQEGPDEAKIPILLQGSSIVFDPTQLTLPGRRYDEPWTEHQFSLEIQLKRVDGEWRIVTIQPGEFTGSTRTMMWKGGV